MLYQVNCKGLRPYYTEGYIDALHHYAQLKMITTRCSMRRVKWQKIMKGVFAK